VNKDWKSFDVKLASGDAQKVEVVVSETVPSK